MPDVAMTAINLPISNLTATKAFFEKLGFSFNPQFSDDTGVCLVINATTIAMLLMHEKFKSFSHAPIPDPRATTGTLIALALESREAVDALCDAALAAGGSEPTPANDYGFMYQRTFADLDGHRWEPFFFDTSKMPLQ
jgi:uncharacterized protein